MNPFEYNAFEYIKPGLCTTFCSYNEIYNLRISDLSKNSRTGRSI